MIFMRAEKLHSKANKKMNFSNGGILSIWG